jgi:hypothetical protein
MVRSGGSQQVVSGAACVPVRVAVDTSRMGLGCEPGLGYVRQRFRRSVRGGGQS